MISVELLISQYREVIIILTIPVVKNGPPSLKIPVVNPLAAVRHSPLAAVRHSPLAIGTPLTRENRHDLVSLGDRLFF